MTSNANNPLPPASTVAPSSPAVATPLPTAMKIEEMETQLNSLLESIQKQNLSHAQIQNTLFSLQQQMELIKTQIDLEKTNNSYLLKQMKIVFEDLKKTVKPKYRCVDDLPGIRVPKWYNVDINFPASDALEFISNTEFEGTRSESGTIGITPDGPFIVTQITPFWQYLDPIPAKETVLGTTFRMSNPTYDFAGSEYILQMYSGRYLPVSIYSLACKSLGRVNTSFNIPSLSQLNSDKDSAIGQNAMGVWNDIPEFAIQIKITGNGRLWADNPIPGHNLYGDGGKPLFTGTAGIFERNDRITVRADMLRNIIPYGRLKVVFHGYQILNPIVAADLLGY